MKKLLTAVLLLMPALSWAARDVTVVNPVGDPIPAVMTSPVTTVASAAATVVQGGSGTNTDPWFTSLSRRSDGVEFGLAASPFGITIFDATGDQVGVNANGTMSVGNVSGAALASEATLTTNANAVGATNTRSTGFGDGLNVEGVQVHDATAMTLANEQPVMTGGLDYDDGGATAKPYFWSMNQDGAGKVRIFDENFNPMTINTAAVTVLESALPTGAATAANQTTGNTSLNQIDAGVTIISGAVSGSEMQVDVVVFPDNEPFDVAQIAGTTTSVNSGSADAGTQRMILADDQDPVTIDSRRPTEELKFASVTITGSGATTIKAAVSGKKIVIAYLVSSFSVASGTARAEGVIHYGARGVTSEWFPFDYPNFGGDTTPWPMGNEPKNETANEPVVIQVDDMDGNSPRLKVTIGYREVD